jgi:hypothetical protein
MHSRPIALPYGFGFLGVVQSNMNGRVALSRITDVNGQNGKSFPVTLDKKESRDRLQLRLDDFGELCYLLDVERNATKPPTGWPKPRPISDAQTN